MLQYVSHMLLLLGATGLAGVVFAVAAWRRFSSRRRSEAGARSERRQRRSEQVAHVLRLASEIRAVSLTIESDLAAFRSIPSLVTLQTRSRRVRLRAEALLQAKDRLGDLPSFELDAQVASVHTDHLRMVELRAFADQEISGWRKHVRRGTREARSTWPFVTTPLTTSTLDL